MQVAVALKPAHPILLSKNKKRTRNPKGKAGAKLEESLLKALEFPSA